MEFGVGSIVDGKVTGITKFGAFVALPEGRSGLVHISEIAYSYVNEVCDYLKEGQEVKVKVIGIDQANRINLSIKKVNDPPQRVAGGVSGRQTSPPGRAPSQRAPFRGYVRPVPPRPRSRRTLRTVSASLCRRPTASSLSCVIWRRRAATAAAAAAGKPYIKPCGTTVRTVFFFRKEKRLPKEAPSVGGEMCRLVSCNQKVP